MSIKNTILPPLLWLYLPIAWLIGQIMIELAFPPSAILNIHAEGNIHELLQFGLITTSFLICCVILFKMDRSANLWLTGWISLSALCCFYVGIEEVSWGQSFFNWHTSTEWQQINKQGETNLHNTSRMLNQIPRYVLMASIAIGGLIIPLITWLKPTLILERFSIFLPPNILSITAICLLIIGLSNKLYKIILDEKLFMRTSEIEEIFMFFFIFLYIVTLKKRIPTKR